MAESKDKQTKPANHYKINNNSANIPSLSLAITTYSADYIREHIELTASGWNAKEAVASMEYLIDSIKKVKKNTKD